MEFVDLKVERRTGTGKGVARELRRQGQIPAILYGEGEPIPLTADPKGLLRALGTEAGENVILNLTIVDGKDFTRKAMVKELQVDPVTGRPLHADFLTISMERPIEVEVPVEAVGVAIGVKEKGGILDQILRQLRVRCLPGAIPDRIALDVSSLDIGDVLHVSDIPIPGGVELLTDLEQTVVTVVAPKVEVEEVAAPVAEEVAAAAAAEEEPAKEPGAEAEDAAKPGTKAPPKKE
ncbi:MAG: 50S ribosomal protein L25 [Candidatus Methylomirabilales bacterium]